MKYALRFVWHVARIVIIAASAFAILVVAFFVAMDSANVYVIVTDGMKAKAQAELIPNSGVDLSKYFSNTYLAANPVQMNEKYQAFIISDIDYKISVESLWCQPWHDSATITIVESIPEMSYSLTEENEDKDKTDMPLPQWPRAKYKLTCKRQNDVWRITDITLVQNLLPEPTPSPEPSVFITASPPPTATPSATLSQSPNTSPTATASGK